MNIKTKTKPLLGILATPYISSKFKKKQVYLKRDFLKYLKKAGINYIVIPYNIGKPRLNQYLDRVNGLYFPGSQIGNYYATPEFKKHFQICEYLIKKAIIINKCERRLPILGICHGFENMMLIGANLKPTKKNIRIFLSTVFAGGDYKTKLRTSSRKYNYKKPVLHNNSLGVLPRTFKKNRTLRKKYNILATGLDRNSEKFIEIVKAKYMPFYGFQFHAELSDPKFFFADFLRDMQISFIKSNNKNNKNNKTSNMKHKRLHKKTRKCKKYGLSLNNRDKCTFYKV